MMDLSRFNQGLEEIKADIRDAEEKTFQELPAGEYDVAITGLEMKETKSGDALMLSTVMQVLSGPYKNRLIFYNQMLMTGFGIHQANNFLKSLDTGADVKFDDFIKYDELIKEIFFTIGQENLEYKIELSRKQSKNGKTYENYKIIEVFGD